ncbi:MAG: hypothetical protein Q7T08_13935 [Devosia sp.]|nr:hypothetical protein [Devosia sp.]
MPGAGEILSKVGIILASLRIIMKRALICVNLAAGRAGYRDNNAGGAGKRKALFR